MKHFLGIDIGTSGTKVLAMGEDGAITAIAHREYALSTPQPLWAEQNPHDWWQATCDCLQEILTKISPKDVAGVGLTGQMHGLVLLDKQGQVLRPAILWCDQRTAAQCSQIEEKVGAKVLFDQTRNPVLTGFTAPKILWVRQHEPHVYEKTAQMLLPKDYIRWKLSGEFATDVSDASGTSLLDVPGRSWSTKVLSALQIDAATLPKVYESDQITGNINAGAAAQTGLLEGTPIVAGGGDQAANAVGNGIVQNGLVSVASGTSGVVFTSTEEPLSDPQLRLHTFCHAVPGKWHAMGVMLSAGGSLRWFKDAFYEAESTFAAKEGRDIYDLITANAAQIGPGAEGLLFLPYLCRERTPHPDPLARGAFVGLTLRHGKSHLARAVLESITFGLRDSLEIIKEMGIIPQQLRLSGGGAKSTFWRQMQTDIFGIPSVTVQSDQGPALGAAILAAVGTGNFDSVPEACDALIHTESQTAPDTAAVAAYELYYKEYQKLYPALRDSFRALSEMQ